MLLLLKCYANKIVKSLIDLTILFLVGSKGGDQTIFFPFSYLTSLDDCCNKQFFTTPKPVKSANRQKAVEEKKENIFAFSSLK